MSSSRSSKAHDVRRQLFGNIKRGKFDTELQPASPIFPSPVQEPEVSNEQSIFYSLHPIRESKVEAYRQGELTTSEIFCDPLPEDDDQIISAIPGVSKRDLQVLLGTERKVKPRFHFGYKRGEPETAKEVNEAWLQEKFGSQGAKTMRAALDPQLMQEQSFLEEAFAKELSAIRRERNSEMRRLEEYTMLVYENGWNEEVYDALKREMTHTLLEE